MTRLGTTITPTFDLRGKELGLWDVVVESGGGEFALPSGFAVEEGRGARLWVDVLGPDTVRPDRERRFWVVAGNAGNVDAARERLCPAAASRAQHSTP